MSAVDKFCYVTLRYQPPFFEHISRVCWAKVEHVSNNLDIENPAIRGMLEYLNKADVGFEIHHQGDLPARSGMGTSSAFVVGLLNAHYALTGIKGLINDCSLLNDMKRNYRHALSLAKTAVRVEREYIGDEVGVQDQHASAIGGVFFMMIDQSGEPTVIKCNVRECDLLEKRLMLVYLGTARHASEVAKAQVAEMDEHASEMHAMMEQAGHGFEILTGTKPMSDFPIMLRDAWALKRKLSPIISSPEIDRIHDGLIDAGASAVKLIGAGAGGFMLTYVEPDKRQGVKEWARAYKFVPIDFKFCYTGSEIIFSEHARQATEDR